MPLTMTRTVGKEQPIEINVGGWLQAASFSANGEYLVIGGDGVRAWRVYEGKQLTRMEAGNVNCLAVSRDGRWIAAGAECGDVFVWNAETHEQVFWHKDDDKKINGIDFSPHSSSTHLVTASNDDTVSIWDFSTHERVQTFDHEVCVRAAKYSPQGDRIATATWDSVRVWDSNDACLLVHINVTVHPWYNTGLLWFNYHLFVLSDSKIKAFEASTGSAVSKWAVPESDGFSCIALPKHGEFIAYSTKRSVTLWDTATHTQLALIQYPQDICLIVFSPDDRFLAIVGMAGNITFNQISRITDEFTLTRLHSTSQEPDIQIDDAALHPWQLNQPVNTEALSNATTPLSQNSSHHADITIQQRSCEDLYAAGRIKEAGESLLDMVNIIDDDVHMTGPIINWVSDFLQRYLSTPESSVDTTLHSPSRVLLLREWAKLNLTGSSWKVALSAAPNLTPPRFMIYRALCDHLETTNHIADAIECFHQMNSELARETSMHGERANWTEDFTQRCAKRLEQLGDIAADAQRHDEAIAQYSIALSLDPVIQQDVFMKRSNVYMAKELWEDVIDDANHVISGDPSSPWGYERKHVALHRAGRYDDAIRTFELMLLKILRSPDPEIRKRLGDYVNPDETKAAIRASIKNATRKCPLVLINTHSGRLLDRSEQDHSFESQPIFRELISSMTTHTDHARIEREVTEYFRYATFSHKWEGNEPLFEKVTRIVVYDLEESLTHDKLQMFCKIVRDAGFHWAWSDTCCINKADHVVLQEALVSMFKWYDGSAVTIVFLRGVRSPSKRGDLVRCIWNTRAWTLQEYHASKVVRFYTEDWKPYLNLDIPNHKESPEIISEMEEATGVSARFLMALRPGLHDIREKLCLASTRQTTRVEDAAYSLLGIFSMSLPVVYGEADQALGRFLGQLLTSSGDTSILAWTGRSGGFNSCLPAEIIVFNQRPTTHIPPALEHAEMDQITTRLQRPFRNSTSTMKFYEELRQLPAPLFAGQRMKLPCIKFKLGPLQSTSTHVFRAQASLLGVVTITSEEDLSRFDRLFLVHPWIDFLLDQQPVGSVADMVPKENTANHFPLIAEASVASPSAFPQDTVSPWPLSDKPRPRRHSHTESLQPPSSLSPMEMQMLALQVIARLTRPFGALLLTPDRSLGAVYKRVAAESLITVRVAEEITPEILDKLIRNVHTLDVL
ncbi:hypothetical protein OG21DRAFT_1604034 [Imleria badia]|nr:hypothetical protein OG21DRAFT_1604034 [Imleria badia]